MMFQTVDYIGGSSSHSNKKLTLEEREAIRNLREWIREEFKKRPFKIIMPCRLEKENEN